MIFSCATLLKSTSRCLQLVNFKCPDRLPNRSNLQPLKIPRLGPRLGPRAHGENLTVTVTTQAFKSSWTDSETRSCPRASPGYRLSGISSLRLGWRRDLAKHCHGPVPPFYLRLPLAMVPSLQQHWRQRTVGSHGNRDNHDASGQKFGKSNLDSDS